MRSETAADPPPYPAYWNWLSFSVRIVFTFQTNPRIRPNSSIPLSFGKKSSCNSFANSSPPHFSKCMLAEGRGRRIRSVAFFFLRNSAAMHQPSILLPQSARSVSLLKMFASKHTSLMHTARMHGFLNPLLDPSMHGSLRCRLCC